jgi:isoleucyl-tRNA synthetase
MYLEGGDQYRGWFHSSLLIGVGLKGASPYRECLTNGWTLDGEGRAMSKSLGNVIEPEKIIKQHGAEVLRLWVASVEFNEDVRLSDTILTRLTEAYRKLRNTFRYALGNLSDFDPEVDSVPVDQLDEVDQWILWRTDELIAKCRAWYDEYAFHRVYRAAYDFATTDLSAVYFDTAKDRLYTAAPRSPRRRSAQTALYRVTYVLARLLAPILTFTTEEVWGHLPLPAGAPRTVHISLLPAPGECLGEASESLRNRMANWPRLMEVRDSVLKRLDEARQQKLIGAPLEAAVTLRAGGDLYNLLQSYGPMLPDLFIVSHVTLEEGEGDLAVSVDRAAGHKCERCWKYKADVGSDSDYPTICASCSDSVREILAA